MADLTALQYGRVTGRFTAIIGDSADAGSNPDAVPMSGSVTFTPLVSGPVQVPGAIPPQVVVPTPIVATLDANGDLTDAQGNPGVTLMASDGPTNPTNIQYRVGFALTYETSDVNMSSFIISVPAGSVQDLALLIPAATPDPVTPVVYQLPPQVVVGGTVEPTTIVGSGLWFKEISPGVYELWLQKG